MIKLSVSLVAALSFGCSTLADHRPDAPIEAEDTPSLQLGRAVVPQRYELTMEIDPAQAGFRGSGSIDVRVDKPRTVIWLHGNGLHISAAQVEAAGRALPARYEQVNDDGVAKLTVSEAVPAGPAVLRFSWQAKFDPRLVGLYVTSEGGLRYASTQFESLDARRAFPGFDDPQFKTPFDVTLVVPKDAVAVANTLPVEEKIEGVQKRIRYHRTRPLPTYLLAWVVGPYDVVEARPLPPNEVRHRPLPLRGIAPRGRGPELASALQASAEITPILERYFGIEFPYPKLDHAALPDFEHGAMENAGLITYREGALLFKDRLGGEERRLRIAAVIAHETAHQWFGDLVTLPWWTDAWLNEGFATWMGNKAVRLWKPKAAPLYDVTSADLIMQSDELMSARAIRQPLIRLSDVWNQFDRITYVKGASVLRMFERWVSEDAFRQGISAYLLTHADGTGTTDSLLEHLEKASGKKLAAPFRTFLDQPGVPLVEARLDCDAAGAKLHLRQSRYLPLGSDGNRDAPVWQIPVCARAGARDACTLLESREGDLDLGPGCPAWVMPNANASGYYRWALAPASLQKLAASYAELQPRERLSFALQLRAALRAGAVDAADALAQLPRLAADAEPEIALVPLETLELAIHELAGPQAARARAFAAAVYKPVAARLGWSASKDDEQPQRRLRTKVLAFLALEAEDPETRAQAIERGRAHVAGGELHPDAVEPDLAAVALAAAIEEDAGPVFESALAVFHASNDPGVRSRILTALGHARDPKLLDRALALALDERLRGNERLTALETAFERPRLREQAWRWMKANVDAVSKLVPEGYLAYLPKMAQSFCDDEHRQDVHAFFAPRAEKIRGMPRNLAQADEKMKLCAAQKKAHAARAQAFFQHEQLSAR